MTYCCLYDLHYQTKLDENSYYRTKSLTEFCESNFSVRVATVKNNFYAPPPQKKNFVAEG